MRACPRIAAAFLCFALGSHIGAPTSPLQAADKPAAASKPSVSIRVTRHEPCNLFLPDDSVKLEFTLSSATAGPITVDSQLTDYFGRNVWSHQDTLTLDAGKDKPATLTLEPGRLPSGYYELKLTHARDPGIPTTVSLGVAPQVARTAAQVRDGGYRFGMKMYLAPKPWDAELATDACVKLGLQWTRVIFNQGEPLPLEKLHAHYPMNMVYKVERFPRELYDAERYGPLEEWEKKFGRGSWTLKTLPKEEPYKAWLREQIAALPKDQNVFEVWNEPWDKMSPEDCATLCKWIGDVILPLRPDSVIGPNLWGNTSDFQFDARVIKAGGMQNMKMVALHPYASSEDRAWFRNYRAWLKEKTGRDIDIYITEYGSHSTPQGPAARSEREQAQRVVRQSLALYAEGVRALIPHWMGQTERSPTYIEDWFGFFRLNMQPKPALLAHATSARMIDASRYVGDLWLGAELDAMVFERAGEFTLALFTRGQEKSIELDAGAAQVTLVDMVGATRPAKTESGKLKLKVDGDVTYVVGISPSLAKTASTQLRPDRWPAPEKPQRMTRAAPKFTAPPSFESTLAGWQAGVPIALLNPKVAGDDCSATAYLGWDESSLYVAVNVRDNEVLNNKPRAKLYQQDSLELFVSTQPRDSGAGYSPHDFQFLITPTSGEGAPIVAVVADRQAGTLVNIDGAKSKIGKTAKGWAAAVAIPWKALGNFTPKAGAKLALDLRLNDADTVHERFKIDPVDVTINPEDPSQWSYLTLSDTPIPNASGTSALSPIISDVNAISSTAPAPAPSPAPASAKPASKETKPAEKSTKAVAAGPVAAWRFDGVADLAGGSVIKLDTHTTAASEDSLLMPGSKFVAGATGIGAGWNSFLANGFLDVDSGNGPANSGKHGLITQSSKTASDNKTNNARYADYMGFAGHGTGDKGVTIYMIVSPKDNWGVGRRGLMGTGYGIGKVASAGAVTLFVDSGMVRLRVGRGENPTQPGHTAPAADLNSDGDQEDYVFAETTVTQPWPMGAWFFIAASWREGAAPVLYVRRMNEKGLADSPAAALGVATPKSGNIIAEVPTQSGEPRHDPLVIGAQWINHGNGNTADGAGARFAFVRIDNVCATVADMERTLASLANHPGSN